MIKLSSFYFNVANLVLLLAKTDMNWLTRAVTLKPSVWAVWFWQHVLDAYNCVKHAIANGIGEQDCEYECECGSECKGDIGAENVNIEDDLRTAENTLVSVVALVARLRMDYVL
ncbi:MAG: hypothetical protein AAI902_00750 [Candidatus Hodgkinia cicadicola]